MHHSANQQQRALTTKAGQRERKPTRQHPWHMTANNKLLQLQRHTKAFSYQTPWASVYEYRSRCSTVCTWRPHFEPGVPTSLASNPALGANTASTGQQQPAQQRAPAANAVLGAPPAANVGSMPIAMFNGRSRIANGLSLIAT